MQAIAKLPSGSRSRSGGTLGPRGSRRRVAAMRPSSGPCACGRSRGRGFQPARWTRRLPLAVAGERPGTLPVEPRTVTSGGAGADIQRRAAGRLAGAMVPPHATRPMACSNAPARSAASRPGPAGVLWRRIAGGCSVRALPAAAPPGQCAPAFEPPSIVRAGSRPSRLHSGCLGRAGHEGSLAAAQAATGLYCQSPSGQKGGRGGR